MRALIFFLIAALALQFVHAGEKTTCEQYLKMPCDCGVCGWFYVLQPECKAQNLTHCALGGYYLKGPNEDKCCKPDYAKMIIITAIVVGFVALWCVLILAIVLLKRRQRKHRQLGALDAVGDVLPPTVYGYRNDSIFAGKGPYAGESFRNGPNPLDDWRVTTGRTESVASLPRQVTYAGGFKADSFLGR